MRFRTVVNVVTSGIIGFPGLDKLSRITIHRVLSYSPRLIIRGAMPQPAKAMFYSLAGRVV